MATETPCGTIVMNEAGESGEGEFRMGMVFLVILTLTGNIDHNDRAVKWIIVPGSGLGDGIGHDPEHMSDALAQVAFMLLLGLAVSTPIVKKRRHRQRRCIAQKSRHVVNLSDGETYVPLQKSSSQRNAEQTFHADLPKGLTRLGIGS
jgi:hypothetical protein